MSVDRDPHPESPAAEGAGDVAAARPSPVEVQRDPVSFESIEAEGARERWLLARRTARSVFTDPALVTPRRMALLGEQGLAVFVDEVRSAARYLIRKERAKRTAEPQTDNSAPDEAAPDEATGDGTTELKRGSPVSRRRRPAAFQAPRPAARDPIARTLVRRLRPGPDLKRFAVDTLFWSTLPPAILIAAVLAYRVVFVLLR